MAVARKRKRRYHHGNLKDELLRVGLELVSEDGPEALSMRALSRRAGVSHAAPYRHFADRRELLGAIAGQGFERLDRCLTDAGSRSRDPLSRAIAVATAYVDFAVRNPAEYALMYGPEVLSEQATDLHATARAPLSDAVAAIVTDDAASATDVLWASLHGLATLLTNGLIDVRPVAGRPERRPGNGRGTDADAVRRAVETLIRGIDQGDPARRPETGWPTTGTRQRRSRRNRERAPRLS